MDPALGDLVAVSGAGVGGWKIAQNAGQQVHVGFENALWTSYGPSGSWFAVAASSDRVHLAAGASDGSIYTSTDGGATWTARTVVGPSMQVLASSADGALLLTGLYAGQLHVSSDSGATWNAAGPSLAWTAVACSPDDTHMIASGYDPINFQYQVWVSANAGTSWTELPANTYFSSMVWPTPTELIATGYTPGAGGIIVSSDAGATWASHTPNEYSALAASSDGSKIYAVGNGGLAVSSDSGATWSVKDAGQWLSVATSPDGSAAVVGQSTGAPAVSTDSGQNWTVLASGVVENAAFVVGSDDEHIIAAPAGGPFYALAAVTTAGTTGFLAGDQFQSVTLQYFGGGMFSVVDNEGQLSVQ